MRTYPREPFTGPLPENTRAIPLTQGQYALVDEEDYDDLMQFQWYAAWSPLTQSFYAQRNTTSLSGGRKSETMHRRVSQFRWLKVDHINHNTLDNRKSNLRDGSEFNSRNRRVSSGGTSQYHGVHWATRQGKWSAYIRVKGKAKFLGNFEDELEAALAYDRASVLYHGEYGTRNFVGLEGRVGNDG